MIKISKIIIIDLLTFNNTIYAKKKKKKNLNKN